MLGNAEDDDGYLDRVVAAATTPNGVFGAKVHWEHFLNLVAKVERGLSPEVARSAAGSGEAFFLGLRLDEGIVIAENVVVGNDADWSRYREGIERCLGAGLLQAEGPRIRLTARGVLLSNEVFAEFV